MPCDPVPTPVPTVGTPCDLNSSFARKDFVAVCAVRATPDFGRFYGSRGSYIGDAALAKNLPHRSRENGFTHGRVWTVKDKAVLERIWTGKTGWRGSVTAPLPEDEWCHDGTQVFNGLQPKTCELSSLVRESRLFPDAPSAEPSKLETSQDFGCREDHASQYAIRSQGPFKGA